MARRSLATLALILAAAGGAGTQTPARRLTTVAALYQFPSYFHLQNVMLHGEFVENGSQVVLRGGERDVPVMLTDAKSAGGLVEVRGQLLDIGRLEPGDPRVRAYMGSSEAERWPRPGEELVLSVTSVTEAQLATTPSVRALTLQPWRFEGQKVTVVGEFRGRNLFGDQPSAPGKSRYDFVLRSVDAAVWVTDLRPRGRGFDLSVEARVDTGRWLEVSGTVTQERGLVTISGTTVNTTTPPQEPAAEETSTPAPPPEPGEVVFSTPTESETDVALTRTVRVQFSRGLDAASLTDRIRVGYVGVVQPPAASEQPLQFTYSYDAATRAVEIRFSQPPERFRTIRVDVLEGVRTFDGAPVRPWMLTFSVGG
ncbi:MAG: Ig-like domain-containing protein [Vicinamibacterales bacterium]